MSHLSIGKQLSLCIALLMYGSSVYASHNKKEIACILSRAPFAHGSSFLITNTEWQELALADYVSLYDTTITAFGTWGLTKLTEPIADMQQVMARQRTVIKLDDDLMLHAHIHTLLQTIKEQYIRIAVCQWTNET